MVNVLLDFYRKRRSDVKKIVFFVFCLLVFGSLGFLGFKMTHSYQNLEHGRALQPTKALLEDFTLLDTSGHEVHKDRFLGHWTILTFGFISCPDICPLTLSYLRDEWQEWPHKPKNLQIIFVGTDTKHDHGQALERFVHTYHSSIEGWSGKNDDIQTLARMLGASAVKNPDDHDPNRILHSTHLFVINPQGELAAIFTPPLTQGSLIQDVTTLIEQYRKIL